MVRHMIRELMHDPLFLARKSEPATAADLGVAKDLLDTLVAHKDSCVGMAANMIGVTKRIIAFNNNGLFMTMFNPEITAQHGPYFTEEGCLSLLGGPRPVKRYKRITVRFQIRDFQTRTMDFDGWTAQIIQHEVDHCNGVLI